MTKRWDQEGHDSVFYTTCRARRFPIPRENLRPKLFPNDLQPVCLTLTPTTLYARGSRVYAMPAHPLFHELTIYIYIEFAD